MPDFKVNYFFEGRLNTGWSETLYTTATDYTTALGRATQLADFRGALSGKDITLFDIRVSDDSIIGDSLTSGPRTIEPVVKTKDADVSWTAAQIRMLSGSLYRRTLMLRGVPDFLYSLENDDVPFQGQWTKAFERYRNKLVQLQFSIKAKARTGPGAALKIGTITVGVGNPPNYLVTTFLAHGLVPGDQVFLYNLKEAPQLAGLQTVAGLSGANGFIINKDPSPAFVYRQRSYLRKVTYIYPIIDSAQFIRIAKRATGRPFALFRGRAR